MTPRRILACGLFCFSVLLFAACDGAEKDDDTLNTPALTCTSPLRVMLPDEVAQLDWEFTNMDPVDTLTIEPDVEADPSIFFENTGTLSTSDRPNRAFLRAPSTILNPLLFQVAAEAADGTRGSCRVVFLPSIGRAYPLATTDVGPFANPLATVYTLPTPPVGFADIYGLKASSIFPMKDINWPNTAGAFLGVSTLTSQIAINIVGKLVVTKTGVHAFNLVARTGANFWLNGQKLITNAGSGGATTYSYLMPGDYNFLVEYYLTTGNTELRLLWQEPGSGLVAIPATSLKF